MLHQMNLQPGPFSKMEAGSKTIEVRLNDPKRQLLKIGDQVEFLFAPDPERKILTIVKDLYHFKTFKDLYYSFDPAEYGSENKDEYVKMAQYYSTEDEANYGVLGIRIQKS